MKKSKMLIILVCMSFVSLLSLPGLVKTAQGQGKDEKPQLENKSVKTSSTNENFSDEKKEFKTKAKARLDELGKKIDELEAESKKAGSKVKTETKEGLRELKEKRTALKKEIRKLKAKSKTKWEQAKQKIHAAEDELEEAYNKVRNKF